MTPHEYAKDLDEGLRALIKASRQVITEKTAQYLPSRPTIIQFPVNDICNSKCTMCNIWKQKRDYEINAEELRSILKNELFKDIEFVGYSGGEPTLKKDLCEMTEAMIATLPKLKSFHIITNAIRAKKVTESVLALNEIAKNHKLGFGSSVSLDGIGHIHDLNRGVKGNFNSAVEVIESLTSNQVPVFIGCTITPINCYYLDDVLEWCLDRSLPFAFRMGVEIKRLYNDEYKSQNNFTQEQLFHIIQFFEKLHEHPQVHGARKLIYKSLIDQLSEGRARQSGCDWKMKGVTLDCRGGISYCSVQSPILGSSLKESAWSIFKDNVHIRRDIIKNECDSCSHDLIGPPPPRIIASQGWNKIKDPWVKDFKIIKKQWNKPFISKLNSPTIPKKERARDWSRVLITGWYGTETAGDKAILGGLIDFIKSNSPSCQITITTLNKTVSKQTHSELNLDSSIHYIDFEKAHLKKNMKAFDAIIFGGGPIMGIKQLENIKEQFESANSLKIARVIFGCGLGPLKTPESNKTAERIIHITTSGFFRDQESLNTAKSMSVSEDLSLGCDPAIDFISKHYEIKQCEDKIVTLVRENTSEYLSKDIAKEVQTSVSSLSSIIDHYSSTHKLHLLPMHAIRVGGDDRVFNRKVYNQCNIKDNIKLTRSYPTLDQLIQNIQNASASIAMRYHGHLFSLALGIPFLSMDYTGKQGKVSNLNKRINWTSNSIAWNSRKSEDAIKILDNILTDRRTLSTQLIEKRNQLLDTYSKACKVLA